MRTLLSMLITLTLLKSASSTSSSLSSDCPYSLAKCECADRALYCPSWRDHKFALHIQSRQLWLQCNPQKLITPADLISTFGDLDLHESVFEARLQHCPVPLTSYSDYFRTMNTSDVLKELQIQYGFSANNTLAKGQFEGLRNLESLKIERLRDISLNSSGVFEGLTNLKSLSIVGNGFKSLPSEFFKSLSGLKLLHLLEFALEELPEDLLWTQTKLKRLKLNGRQLRELPSKLLVNCTELTTVQLLLNNVTIPQDFFSQTTSLTNFTFSGESLFYSENNIFEKTSLTIFQWLFFTCPQRNCKMKVPALFKGVEGSLKSFEFTRATKVQSLIMDDSLLRGCRRLQKFKVFMASLSALSEDFFLDSSQLTEIDLRNNLLSSLPSKLFRGLTRLRSLLVQNNRIEDLPKGLFDDLRVLEELRLDNNRLKKIDANIFAYLPKLKTLVLRDNQLSLEPQPDWTHLIDLRHLDLSSNKINGSALPIAFSVNLAQMQVLNMSHNQIGPIIDATELNFQQKRIQVDLRFNRIESIDFELVKCCLPKTTEINEESSPAHILSPKYAAVVLLTDNYLKCDCKSLDLWMHINDHYSVRDWASRYWFFINDEPLCNEPANLRSRILADLEPDRLVCDIEETFDQICPQNCHCEYVAFNNLVNINCNDMSELPKELPHMNASIALGMANNELEGMLRLQLDNNLTSLNLSNNALTNLEISNNRGQLKNMYLDHNKLRIMDEHLKELLENLDRSSLSNNPFLCECKNVKQLLKLSQRLKSRIIDNEQISALCKGQMVKLTEIELEILCSSLLKSLLPIILVLVLVLVAILVVVIVILSHKRSLSIWLYSNPTLRSFFPEELADMDKPYDAFISYSSFDHSFVEDILIPGLEKDENELSYKCLFHERDFDVGRNIVEQIVEAVESSRRTLIVLSRSFVKSEWFQREFELAHSLKRVIVIVLDELPSEEDMGSLMSSYIKTNTFLKHDDPWFWQKLRYALPHRGGSVGNRVVRALTSKKRRMGTGNVDDISLIARANGKSNEGFSSNPVSSVINDDEDDFFYSNNVKHPNVPTIT